MKQEKRTEISVALLAATTAISLLAGSVSVAQPAINAAVGKYDVIATSNTDDHEGAVIIIARTNKASGFVNGNTFGLAFLQTDTQVPADIGDGMVCSETNLQPGQRQLRCGKPLLQMNGVHQATEVLEVGTLGSDFCNALKVDFPDQILTETDEECDGSNPANELCICYQIRVEDDDGLGVPRNPPHEGSGTGRRGG